MFAGCAAYLHRRDGVAEYKVLRVAGWHDKGLILRNARSGERKSYALRQSPGLGFSSERTGHYPIEYVFVSILRG